MKKNRSSIVFPLFLVTLGILGAAYLNYTWTSVLKEASDRALLIGKTSATTLNGEMLKQLRGISDDVGTVAYESIKTRLTNLLDADTNIRFAYIYTQRNGKLYFLADSEPANSEDYSPPGQEYAEASAEYFQPFIDGQALVTQPTTDRWGRWVSVLVPIKGADTDKVKEVFALDYPAASWVNEAIVNTTQAGIIVGALLLLLLTLYKIVDTGIKARAAENRLKSLLSSMNDLVFVLDRDLVFREYYQPRTTELLVPPENFIGKSFDKVGFPKPAYTILKKALLQTLRTGEPTATEYNLDLPAGRLWFEVHITSLVDGGGKTIGLTCVAHNINKRKLAEEQSRFKTMLLEAQSESSIDGILAVDAERNPILVNKRFGEVWKMPLPAIGKRDAKMLEYILSQLKTPEVLEVQVDHLGKHADEKSRAAVELIDGRYLDVYSSPLVGEDKKNYGRIWFFRDITREKEIDKTKSEFVSVASHQLKTPLAGIKWVVELLLGSKIVKPDVKQIEYLQDIQSSNEKMLKLVNDLLDVSHIETGRKFNIEKKETDVAELAIAALKANQPLADGKKVSVILCKDAPQKLLLNIDGDKIGQVFNNLLNNAIKYSKDGGQVEVGCKRGKNDVTFLIKDNGIGIPEKQQSKIFEKFFRADNALTQATDGTGLGLYIAKAIVEAHSGKLWFESVEGKGTTFFFSLPANAK